VACHREYAAAARFFEYPHPRTCSRRLEVSDTDGGVDLGAKKIGTRTDGSSARRKQTAAAFRSVPPNEVCAKGKLKTKSATAAARRSAITGTPPRTGSGQGWRQGARGWRFDNREECSTRMTPNQRDREVAFLLALALTITATRWLRRMMMR
jgi:hypothetical protein